MEAPTELENAWHRLNPGDIRPVSGAVTSLAVLRVWALVLAARGVPHRLIHQADGWSLLVPEHERLRAEMEIRTYEEKNRSWPPPPKPGLKTQDNRLQTLSCLLILAIFHNLTLLDPGLFGLQPQQWLDQGAAHAASIRNGQWWRALTALTLHADWLHLGANLALGSLFVVRLCSLVGLGWGLALFLGSGFVGNLFNAWLQWGGHRSVGASTALFGTIGILCVMAVRGRQDGTPLRRLLPLAAGAAFLAMFGAGGENTDLGAHLFGLLSGLALGAAFPAKFLSPAHPQVPLNRLAGLAALSSLVSAWMLALGPILSR